MMTLATSDKFAYFTENNNVAHLTGVCVCVRVFLVPFLYISQLFSSYPGYEMTRFSVDFMAWNDQQF